MKKNNNVDIDKEESENLKLLRKQILKRKKRYFIKNFGEMPMLIFISIVSLWLSASVCLYLYSVQFDLLIILFNIGEGHVVIWSYVLIGIFVYFVTMIFSYWSLRMFEAKIRLKERDNEKEESYVERLMRK